MAGRHPPTLSQSMVGPPDPGDPQKFQKMFKISFSLLLYNLCTNVVGPHSDTNLPAVKDVTYFD